MLDAPAPPHSVEAEQAVLGGLLIDPSAWDQVADVVCEEDFYRPDHQAIFSGIAAVAGEGKPCDAVTVAGYLERSGALEKAGGLAYLSSIARDTPTAANVRAYAQIVRERSLMRQLIQAGTQIAAAVYNNDGTTARDLVDRAEQRVFEIADGSFRGRDGARPVRDLLPAVIDQIDEWHTNPDKLRGLPTGFTDFDKITGGLRPGDLIIIAGRPSMGKSTLAVNMAEYAAVHPGTRASVAIFTMEMPSDQVITRMLASVGGVPLSSLRSGNISDEDWVRITGATSQLSEAKIFVDETPALNPTELRARARRVKREHGLNLVVVDYLQLMQVPGTVENRATEIAEISRGLKALAKELQVPVIALSQLNRGVEQREHKKPVMSDLRECVTGDTLVCLANGRREPIANLIGTEPEVWALDDRQRLVRARSDKVWKVGRRPIFKVQLASGRSIRATAEHKLLAGPGWTTVGALRLGDRLALARVAAERAGRAQMRIRSVHRQATTSMRVILRGAFPNFRVALNGIAAADYSEALHPEDLETRASSDLCWDRVLAITSEGDEDVFDLTVPGPANWLADGIVTHNSGAIEQDADMILLIYREEVYDKNTTKKGIAEIDLVKHRNGEIGTFLLTFQGQYTRFANYASDSYAEGVLR
ncbi:MAG: replicative DNA helicase [Gammaproteobacteria bacterium]|nr:replicative DNA helicase [Gammaproteobacteria bacterium]